MVAIVIIPDALKALAEAAVLQLAPLSVGESFTVPLVSNVGPPSALPTHWASLPIVSAGTAEQIQQLLSSTPFQGQCGVVICDPDRAVDEFRRLCAHCCLVRMDEES